MKPLLAIAAAALLACLPAAAPAQGSDTETVTLSRRPTGLHSVRDPNFEVTVWPDGLVVMRTLSYRASFPVERVFRFQRSAAEAAAFRAALLPYRRADRTQPTICSGRVHDDVMMIRGYHVFRITWSGPDHFSSLGVCYDEQERMIVSAIERALEAVNLTLDGAER